MDKTSGAYTVFYVEDLASLNVAIPHQVWPTAQIRRKAPIIAGALGAPVENPLVDFYMAAPTKTQPTRL